MARLQINARISPALAEILDRVCALRGLTRTEVLVHGILAQAEAFGVIPSVAATLAQVRPEPKTSAELRERQRLSQQRSRARKQGAGDPENAPLRGKRR